MFFFPLFFKNNHCSLLAADVHMLLEVVVYRLSQRAACVKLFQKPQHRWNKLEYIDIEEGSSLGHFLFALWSRAQNMHAALASGGHFGCRCPLSVFFFFTWIRKCHQRIHPKNLWAWLKYQFWVDRPFNIFRNVNTDKCTTSVLSPVRSGRSIFVKQTFSLLNYFDFMLLRWHKTNHIMKSGNYISLQLQERLFFLKYKERSLREKKQTI